MTKRMMLAAAALALTLTPGLAVAMCGHDRATTAATCGEGQVFDAAKQVCVDKATS